MVLKTNVIKKEYAFNVILPDGSKTSVFCRAESYESARLLLKSREEAGEFKLLESDADGGR